jgi:hypothetical protein
VLHVLSGVFWAGTTFASARTGGNQADLFFRPQMGAAAIAVVTGGILWFLLHRGVALLAAGVQGITGAPALRKLSALAESEGSRLRQRAASGQRIAAALLAITVSYMAAARYA